MRVTGGQVKGIEIKAPRGLETRPTSDKVRSAIFNVLGHRVQGTRVLDLFAGSGAMGIEALSRGAEFVVFVEKGAAAARIIKENLEKTGFQNKAEVINLDFRKAIILLHRKEHTFDLLLIDPPYEGNFLEEIASSLQDHPVTVSEAIVVLEHFKKTAPWAEIAKIPHKKTRLYGQTGVSYYFGG